MGLAGAGAAAGEPEVGGVGAVEGNGGGDDGGDGGGGDGSVGEEIQGIPYDSPCS